MYNRMPPTDENCPAPDYGYFVHCSSWVTTVAPPPAAAAHYCQDEQDVAKNSCSRCTVCRSRAHRSKSKVALVIS